MKITQWHLAAGFLLLAIGAADTRAASTDSDHHWHSLFNGKDLSGWETYISYQPETNDYNLKSSQTPRGLNNDPKHVYSVVDGMLRVSGEEWGGLTSVDSFSNFHLRFEMKWGEKKWPPREQVVRDSGVLYLAVGPQGVEHSHWMRSNEFQLQEGDCGDYYSLDGVTVDAQVADAHEGDWQFYRYDPTQPLRKDLANRIVKQGLYEKPLGQWNTMDIISDGQTTIHMVNGHEVLRMHNVRQRVDGKLVPLIRGKFQIQSEGSEVFFRNIQIKTLDKPAADY